MSFGAANMCRIVVAVIFILFVSCVLAETEKKKQEKEKCSHKPEVIESLANLAICFNNTVAQHLDPSIVPKPGQCQNVKDFGEKLNSHLSTIKTVCEWKSMVYNTTDFIKLVDFSLRNESFKKFYDDIHCVKSLESNISNTCVKNKVGFFNITKEKIHTSWYGKTNLQYNSGTCGTSKDVKNCVEVFLNNCQHNSRQYVASLFKYARELADCTRLEKNETTTAAPSGNDSALKAAPLLTTPVIITISIGAVVVVAAVIIIIVLKCKN